jgi:hypothetical protein
MTPAKAMARANETFIVHSSLMNVSYDCQNIFIVQAKELTDALVPFSCLVYKYFLLKFSFRQDPQTLDQLHETQAGISVAPGRGPGAFPPEPLCHLRPGLDAI